MRVAAKGGKRQPLAPKIAQHDARLSRRCSRANPQATTRKAGLQSRRKRTALRAFPLARPRPRKPLTFRSAPRPAYPTMPNSYFSTFHNHRRVAHLNDRSILLLIFRVAHPSDSALGKGGGLGLPSPLFPLPFFISVFDPACIDFFLRTDKTGNCSTTAEPPPTSVSPDSYACNSASRSASCGSIH